MKNGWIDISRPIHKGTAVWPGDCGFRADKKWSMAKGDSVTVHTLTMSVHTGTHADAPNHVSRTGISIDRLPLDAYMGPAYVISKPGNGPVELRHLKQALAAKAERMLIKTAASSSTERKFPRPFSYLTPGAARALTRGGVRLVGIDTPSVDPFTTKTLEVHHILFNGNTLILENLCLKNVKPGPYFLIAAPLRLTGLDASPVRALLKKGSDPF